MCIGYGTNQCGQCQAQILYCLRCWTNSTSTYIARVLIINLTTAQAQVQIPTLYTKLNEKRSLTTKLVGYFLQIGIICNKINQLVNEIKKL